MGKEKHRIASIRSAITNTIKEAVGSQNGSVGTYRRVCGIGKPEEHEYDITICIHNPAYPEAYAGYMGVTLHKLHISNDGLLVCTLGDDSHYDDWDEPIENVQTEGLIKIVEWLVGNGILPGEETWRCKKCGSTAVQEKAWVCTNTGEVESIINGGRDDYYCPDCETHGYFIQENELLTKANEWWGETDFKGMERITCYRQLDFDPDEGWQAFVDACNGWWDGKITDEKITIYLNNQ